MEAASTVTVSYIVIYNKVPKLMRVLASAAVKATSQLPKTNFQ